DEVLALYDDPSFWKFPLVRQHLVSRTMRRFAAAGSRQELLACARLLQAAPGADERALLLDGFEKAFAGRAMPALPEELEAALAGAGRLSLTLRVRRGDLEAVGEAMALLADSQADPDNRLAAVRVFGEIV